jgi:hypothetical protein
LRKTKGIALEFLTLQIKDKCMKNLFFIVFITSATMLCAVSNKSLVDPCDASIGKVQVNLQEDPTIPSEGLACRFK